MVAETDLVEIILADTFDRIGDRISRLHRAEHEARAAINADEIVFVEKQMMEMIQPQVDALAEKAGEIGCEMDELLAAAGYKCSSNRFEYAHRVRDSFARAIHSLASEMVWNKPTEET